MTRLSILASVILTAAFVTASQAESEHPAPLSVDTPAPSPSSDGRESTPILTGRQRFFSAVSREAERNGLPPALADAVVFVESRYDPNAIGKVGEVGLMQVRPPTAAMLGFTGGASGLLDPSTNIHFGVRYLAQAWKLTGGDLCRTLMKYRAGHGEERMTERSITYCSRARTYLAGIGSPLASAAIPTLDLGNPIGKATIRLADERERAYQRRQSDKRRFDDIRRALVQKLWAEHVARLKAIEPRIARIMDGS